MKHFKNLKIMTFNKCYTSMKCSKNMTWLKYIILLKLFKTIFCLIFTYTVLFKKKSIQDEKYPTLNMTLYL